MGKTKSGDQTTLEQVPIAGSRKKQAEVPEFQGNLAHREGQEKYYQIYVQRLCSHIIVDYLLAQGPWAVF